MSRLISRSPSSIFVDRENNLVTVTDAQRKALENISLRWDKFADRGTMEVSHTVGMGGAVVVNVGPMWLAVEADGYTHS